ncbi:hypothetical protein FI667_g1848, partial [Globisporangium splendens]
MEQPQDHQTGDAGNESAAVAVQVEPVTTALEAPQSAPAIPARDGSDDPKKSARTEAKNEESPREAALKSQLRSARAGEGLLLQPKKTATPRASTPRNLVCGERQILVADDDDDIHGDAKGDGCNDQQLQRSDIPLSARKYLTPRKAPEDGTKNNALANDQPIASSTTMNTTTTDHRRHPHRPVALPRSFSGKLHFYISDCCQNFMQAIRSIRQVSRHVSVQQKIACVLMLVGAVGGSVDRGEHHENAILLTPEEFLLLWDALPDGGSFICRVSKIPLVQDLSRHLHLNHFVVASNGPNAANHLRTMHFHAAVQDSTPIRSSNSGWHLSRTQPQFFLGEFISDSLSLKLFAKFRCPQQDAIVPFVKKLQLKEIVGSYAPSSAHSDTNINTIDAAVVSSANEIN